MARAAPTLLSVSVEMYVLETSMNGVSLRDGPLSLDTSSRVSQAVAGVQILHPLWLDGISLCGLVTSWVHLS